MKMAKIIQTCACKTPLWPAQGCCPLCVRARALADELVAEVGTDKALMAALLSPSLAPSSMRHALAKAA